MDKVKEFLALMKKYHFWILTGVLTLLSLGGYYMARSALTEKISTRISALDSKYTMVTTLNSTASTHPNSISSKQMDTIIEAVSKDVHDAWLKQYKVQEEIFVWPQEALLPDALEKVKNFRPVELSLEFPMPPEKDPLKSTDREVYRDYIQRVFPNLARSIGSKWTAELSNVKNAAYGGMPGSSGGPPPGAGSSLYGGQSGPGAADLPVSDSLVVWDSASQQELLNSICYWYDPQTPPNTLQICYTQEDLWVLRGILDIIAKTNKGARENFQAAIKEVEFIRIGRNAMGRAGEITGGSSSAASAYGSMMPGMNPAGGGGGGMPAGYNAMGGGAPTAAARKGPTIDPADGRYVDAKFNAVSGKDLRSKMKLNAPEDAFFAVAKRIPVRMRFKKMDQRKIADLLAECGNAKMVLEVRQVRVSTDPAPAPGAQAGGAASGPGSGRPSLGGGGAAGAEGPDGDPAGAMPGGGGGSSIEVGSSFDVPVEVYGVIYLFNPVDMDKLGIKKVSTDTKIVETVEAAKTDPAGAGTTAAPATSGNGAPVEIESKQGIQPPAGNGQSAVPPAPGAGTPAAPVPPATPNGTTPPQQPNGGAGTTPPVDPQ